MTNYHFRKMSKKKCCNLFDYNTSSFYLFVFSVKFIDINPSIKLLLTKNHYHFYCIPLLFIKNVSLCRFSYFFIFHDSLLLYFLLKHHLSIHIDSSSQFENISSKIIIFDFFINALKKIIFCFSPPDKFIPLSCTK